PAAVPSFQRVETHRDLLLVHAKSPRPFRSHRRTTRDLQLPRPHLRVPAETTRHVRTSNRRVCATQHLHLRRFALPPSPTNASSASSASSPATVAPPFAAANETEQSQHQRTPHHPSPATSDPTLEDARAHSAKCGFS